MSVNKKIVDELMDQRWTDTEGQWMITIAQWALHAQMS